MTSVESELALWRDPRLAALAISASPAWLWSADATRILWANAAGAALLGAADVAESLKRRFDANNPAAAEILRLAATLPPAAAPRFERLRGFGAELSRALTCECSRLAVAGEEPAVLVAAAEPVGPALPLSERVHRLLSGDAGSFAVFAADGALVHATSAGRAELGGAHSLAALGLDGIAAKVLETGTTCVARCGQGGAEVTVQRLGSDAEHVLVLTLPAPPPSSAAVPTLPSPSETPPQIPHVEAPAERRHPLRFVWQMDADGRFIVGSDEFVTLVGPRTMAAFGRKWSEIAAELKLDPDNQIGRAVASHETWSGIVVPWPMDDSNARLPVELSGLPVFDRDRSFRGYRGFGVCRDVARINELAKARREGPIGFVAAPQPPEEASAHPQGAPNVERAAPPEAATRVERAAPNVAPVPSVLPAAANVVPFRPSAPPEPKPAPTLSPVERRAFRELAQELTARLRGSQDGSVAVEGASAEASRAAESIAESAAAGTAGTTGGETAQTSPAAGIDPALFDRIPIGVLVYRHDTLIYANRYFLDWTGYDNLEALAAAGGLSALFAGPGAGPLTESGGAQTLSIVTRGGDPIAVDGRLLAVPWHGASALALILTNGQVAERRRAAETTLTTVEVELRNAKREAQSTADAQADFVAKISHEIRTPLNAMTGFAEVMMAERLGPIGNERYRDYLRDIQSAGTHVVALLNDLLDLSKVETGKLDLNFSNVRVNELTQQCVGIMQPQASRARIIIRTSLTPTLPQVVADERSVRQIMLNLLSNSIKFTGPGGQVIVSTAVSDDSEVVLRVRDTGVGMSETDIAAALEPFRQVATSGSWGSGGNGLGLPLSKALAEANRAHFSIKSAPNAGTLVEIAFPANRVVAG